MTLSKQRTLKLGLLATFLIALLTYFATTTIAQERTEPVTPKAVVSELMDAMQENDADRIQAVFSQDASQAYGNGSPKSGDAFRAWLQSDIIRPHGRVEGAELTVDGESVVVMGQYRNNGGYTAPANFLMQVEDGKITSWQMRY